MPSDQNPREAYVFTWLPEQTEPVVAGRLALADDGKLVFNYGQGYLASADAISLYEKELPLEKGQIELPEGLKMPGCIRDGSPDAWGRRVIINKKYGSAAADMDQGDLTELTYMLESGSDRIGALDFQASAKAYQARENENVDLGELVQAADLIEQGKPLSRNLELALYHGSAIGGARPKALIATGDKKYIAKFSSAGDVYSVIKAEYIAMRLAALSGIHTAAVKQVRAAHKDVLLVERFDRARKREGWTRKSMVSALTMLKLDEDFARYASYEGLAEVIRRDFTGASQTLKELFRRLAFNIICGNTDDHARNHAAFWDGRMLTLTPAYDICPQPRTGNIANQAMEIQGRNRSSQLISCLNAAGIFLLSQAEAADILEDVLTAVIKNWNAVCDEATVTDVDKNLFRTRQFLNPYIFEDLGESHAALRKLERDFRP